MTKNPEFTYEDYFIMIREFLDRGYSFVFFPDAQKLLEDKEKFVLMRHDVDLDLDKALDLAEREAKAGIAATYFFTLRTEHYNVFSKRGAEIVNQILAAGHDFGLHFDCSAYPEDFRIDDFRSACEREAGILEEWFGKPVSTVSYHRPGPLVMSGDPELSAPLPHTYMSLFTKNIKYFSDSRGEWSHGCPTQSHAFKQGIPLHILAHPIWWNEEPTGAYETLSNLCKRKNDAFEDSVSKNCTVYRKE